MTTTARRTQRQGKGPKQVYVVIVVPLWFLIFLVQPQRAAMPPKISVGPFHFTSVGVRISGKPEIADWKGPLQFALWCQRAGPWWIGDLLNAGEDRFGETFSQMCEGAVSAEMLNRYASVARRVPLENRRPGLSWSAHAVTARLPFDVQHDLLLEAERKGWTTDELRERARAAGKRQGET